MEREYKNHFPQIGTNALRIVLLALVTIYWDRFVFAVLVVNVNL